MSPTPTSGRSGPSWGVVRSANSVFQSFPECSISPYPYNSNACLKHAYDGEGNDDDVAPSMNTVMEGLVGIMTTRHSLSSSRSRTLMTICEVGTLHFINGAMTMGSRLFRRRRLWSIICFQPNTVPLRGSGMRSRCRRSSEDIIRDFRRRHEGEGELRVHLDW